MCFEKSATDFRYGNERGEIPLQSAGLQILVEQVDTNAIGLCTFMFTATVQIQVSNP